MIVHRKPLEVCVRRSAQHPVNRTAQAKAPIQLMKKVLSCLFLYEVLSHCKHTLWQCFTQLQQTSPATTQHHATWRRYQPSLQR